VSGAVLTVPDPSLVVLVGVAGSGKSTLAARHFRPTEIVSSDHCRALVADDPGDQSATPAAFDVLHLIVSHRLRFLKLAVVDATNVQPRARHRLIRLAEELNLPAVAIVLDLPVALAEERARTRQERPVDPDVKMTYARLSRRTSPPRSAAEIASAG